MNKLLTKEEEKKSNEQRDITDVDLVFSISTLLGDVVSMTAKDTFLNDISIKSIVKSNNLKQMIIINKYFMNKILIFKATSKVDVSDALMMLVNDATVSDWFKLYNLGLIPFIKKYHVM